METEGISDLFTQWLEVFKDDSRLLVNSQQLFQHFLSLLDRRTLSVSKAVFKGMSKMLSEIENVEILESSLLKITWDIWKSRNPAAHIDDSRRGNGNQDALVTYLHCLLQLLRLNGENILFEQAQMVTQQLRICVVASNDTAYSADIDRMTPVQELVLECLKSVPLNSPQTLEKLVDTIASIVTLAYEEKNGESDKQTYVALSKAAMDLLEYCIFSHINKPHFDPTGIVTKAMSALGVPICLKYKWSPEGKGLPPWKKVRISSQRPETTYYLVYRLYAGHKSSKLVDFFQLFRISSCHEQDL